MGWPPQDNRVGEQVGGWGRVGSRSWKRTGLEALVPCSGGCGGPSIQHLHTPGCPVLWDPKSPTNDETTRERMGHREYAPRPGPGPPPQGAWDGAGGTPLHFASRSLLRCPSGVFWNCVYRCQHSKHISSVPNSRTRRSAAMPFSRFRNLTYAWFCTRHTRRRPNPKPGTVRDGQPVHCGLGRKFTADYETEVGRPTTAPCSTATTRASGRSALGTYTGCQSTAVGSQTDREWQSTRCCTRRCRRGRGIRALEKANKGRGT